MKQLKKWMFFLILAMVTIGILLTGGTWVYLFCQLPDIDGRIVTSSVKEKTRVVRDQWGVPHIQAENGQDAYFALGLATAQDRLFQMELQRRLAKGELAQILGPGLLNVDKMFRTLMIRRWSEEFLADDRNINSQAFGFLDAFLDGVNHFIRTDHLPVEYTLLGFKPEPFTRLDSISMLGYVAYSFADGIKRDSLYTILEQHLTPRDLEMVFPEYTLDNRVTIMEPEGRAAGLDINHQQRTNPLSRDCFAGLDTPLQAALNQAARLSPPFTGSNSWVLAPWRSKNGHALLANDPHIGIANPGVWYEAHVRYPGYENYGYHLPLMPFPMLAHNSVKAWAITMFENDDLDLYAETFHPEDPGRVRFNQEWVKAEIIQETIKVKGMPDEPLTIRVTPHGPVISDFIKQYKGRPVAVSWVYHKLSSPLLDVVFEMGAANTLEQFRDAVSKIAAPGLNISYIDSKGNIAWWAAGRIPIRPAHVSGKQIHDGSMGKDEWLGFIPFDQNPHMVNPDNGLIITANNLSTMEPIGPIPLLTGYFRPSDRAARIYEQLAQKEKWDLESLKKIQTDSKIWAGTDLGQRVVHILEPEGKLFSDIEKKAFAALKSWDGFLETDSVGGTVFQFAIYHILKTALEGYIGPDNLKSYLNQVDHWSFLKQVLKNPAPPIAGKNPGLLPKSRDAIVLEGFKNGVKEIKTRLGSREEDWKWGLAHTIEYVHPIGRKKPLNLFFNIGPFPSSGEFTSVNKMKSKTGNHDYKVSSLPSTRRLIDCNEPDNSWSIIPTGNSGNFMSRFFDDQARMFMDNKYRNIVFSNDQVEKSAVKVMTLVPE